MTRKRKRIIETARDLVEISASNPSLVRELEELRDNPDRMPEGFDDADPELTDALKDYAEAPREERRMTPAEVMEWLRADDEELAIREKALRRLSNYTSFLDQLPADVRERDWDGPEVCGSGPTIHDR